MVVTFLLLFNLILIFISAAFAYESSREQESRAPKFGYAGIIFHVVLGLLILVVPSSYVYVSLYFGLLILIGLAFLIPTKPNSKATQGARGHVVGKVARFDERDQVFARNETLHPDREEYNLYYDTHPELKERDDQRRAKGGDLGKPGSIDSKHPSNVSMLFSSFEMGRILEPNAVNVPPQENETVAIDPKRATEIVKGYARQLGADLVGVCEIDPSWIYSHRGEIHMDNWQDWGREIHADLPYAVVIATEMDHKMVIGAPHTPAVVESSRNYAKGAHITTILARWFTHMGYRATAQHEGHYDALMVPLAVDAGLGQLGRQGYLIADQYGCRVRLSAVLTEMPLTPDKPLDLGVEEFCKACLKCALACPSKSIPSEDKTVNNGTSRWTLSAESCHDYWGKIGTDCCICMAICPYSRPNRSIHKLIKRVIKHSRLARFVLPHLDNMVYGRRWKPRKVAPWVDYRQ